TVNTSVAALIEAPGNVLVGAGSTRAFTTLYIEGWIVELDPATGAARTAGLRAYSPSGGQSGIADMVRRPNGNYLVVGATSETTVDSALGELDANGDWLRSAVFAGDLATPSTYEGLYGVALTPDGGYVVVGRRGGNNTCGTCANTGGLVVKFSA